MSFVRAGYYYRFDGRKTLVLALKKGANITAAFRVARYLWNVVKQSGGNACDERCMNITKFFLYVLFDRHHVEILETKGIALYMAKGKRQRVSPLENAVTYDKKDDDSHELEVIKEYLEADEKQDVVVVVCGSTKVKRRKEERENRHDTLNEYDGILIYPNRKSGQIVFFEAKNKRKTNTKSARQCLIEKLENVKIIYEKDLIKTKNHDCFYEYTVADH